MPPEVPARALPGLVSRYLQRALPEGSEGVRQIRVEQTGQMVRKAGSRALRFTAVERFSVDHVAFSWSARFPILPPISLRVTDGYLEGRGALIVSVLGLRVQAQEGPAVTLGEVYRYLAELPWAPHAILANAELEWREVGETMVEVATAACGERPTVTFEFDADGDIVRCTAPNRPRADLTSGASMPWGEEFTDYRVLGGIRLPARAAVYWDEPDQRFVYFRSEIRSARQLEMPFSAVRGLLPLRPDP